MFKICKANNFNLKWYDYNEPYKGNDQCDHKSAGAKNLMRSYVDAGNYIITALDIVTALKHGNGLQNAETPVFKKDIDKTNLDSEKIPKLHTISQYSLEIHTCCYKGIITLEKV